MMLQALLLELVEHCLQEHLAYLEVVVVVVVVVKMVEMVAQVVEVVDLCLFPQEQLQIQEQFGLTVELVVMVENQVLNMKYLIIKQKDKYYG